MGEREPAHCRSPWRRRAPLRSALATAAGRAIPALAREPNYHILSRQQSFRRAVLVARDQLITEGVLTGTVLLLRIHVCVSKPTGNGELGGRTRWREIVLMDIKQYTRSASKLPGKGQQPAGQTHQRRDARVRYWRDRPDPSSPERGLPSLAKVPERRKHSTSGTICANDLATSA
jgi:hypothetical protein